MQSAPLAGQGLHPLIMGHPGCCPPGPLACTQHPCRSPALGDNLEVYAALTLSLTGLQDSVVLQLLTPLTVALSLLSLTDTAVT